MCRIGRHSERPRLSGLDGTACSHARPRGSSLSTNRNFTTTRGVDMMMNRLQSSGEQSLQEELDGISPPTPLVELL